nr:MAG TPA: hypothetical protein [Caudoviricetes sp.]
MVIKGLGNKKGKATLPGQLQPPGPHGHPDVALPIYTRTPQRRSGGKNKKDRTSCRVGHSKGDGDACSCLGTSGC